MNKASGFLKSPSFVLIVKRLLQAIPVIWGVTFLTYAIMNLLPGGSAQALAPSGATPAQVHAYAVKLGLTKPFFTRYLHWLGGLVTGHLGSSLENSQPVATIIRQRLPITAELVVVAMIISVVAAIPVALLAARKPHGVADRVSMAVTMLGISVPGFVLGLVLILVFAAHFRLLPSEGFVPITQSLASNLKSMVLPSITLAFGLFGRYVRVLRADIADQMEGEDYIVVAKAKGLSPRQVLFRHALKNASFPMLTLVGLNMGTLIGGTVLIEQIFALPGIGQELIIAVVQGDVQVVDGIVVILAIAVVLSSLLTDLFYAVLDPRIRYGRPSI
jgi:peptide/nickel transport system permease protein